MEQAQITTIGYVEQNQQYTTLVKFNLKPRDVVLKLHLPVARKLVRLRQWPIPPTWRVGGIGLKFI
jgi:hypothetical protein